MNKLFVKHDKNHPKLWPILHRVNSEVHQNQALKESLLRQEIRGVRDDIQQQCGQDALSILPKKFVSIGLNQWSCCKTHTSFDDFIGLPLDGLLLIKVFPLLFTHLKKSSVLRCRLVSKSWCQGVDAFLEDYALQWNNKNYLYDHRFLFDPELLQEWKKRESMLQNSFATPLVGGSVRLSLKIHGPEMEFDAIIYFLETWGKHIVSLNVEGPSHFRTAENACLLLCQILLNCPKLRKLIVTEIYVTVVSSKDCQPSYSSPDLLPDHNNLAHLDIKNANFIQGLLLKRYSNQLTSLYINDQSNNLNCHHLDLPNLHNLALECSLFPIMELQTIKAPCLRELDLLQNRDTVSMSTLINLLRRFPSLKTLKLRLESESLLLSDKEIHTLLSSNDWICFHSFEDLELRIPLLEAQKNFDFLIFFPRIKTLRICLETMTAMDVPDLFTSKLRKEHLLDLYESIVCNSEDVYQCNIWKHLPKLNKIELLLTYGRSTKMEKYCYTRSGYEYINSKLRSYYARMISTVLAMCLIFIVLMFIDLY